MAPWFGATPAAATPPGRNGLIAVETFSDTWHTWVVRPDGSGLTRLSFLGQGVFSPDGHRIAFAAADGSLAVTDLNGRNPRVLLKSPNVSIGSVAWSPAGDALYFGGDEAFDPLYAISSNGGSPRRVAHRGSDPDVSVTGRVAYAIYAAPGAAPPTCSVQI
jgi:Tol biopolymer transport system component